MDPLLPARQNPRQIRCQGSIARTVKRYRCRRAVGWAFVRDIRFVSAHRYMILLLQIATEAVVLVCEEELQVSCADGFVGQRCRECAVHPGYRTQRDVCHPPGVRIWSTSDTVDTVDVPCPSDNGRK